MTASPKVVVFFDVDETLIAMKNPFELLRYRLAEEGDDGCGYERIVAPMRHLAAQGRTPVEVVTEFYRGFAGVPWDELMAQGREWYAELRRRGAPFIEASVRALRRHQKEGHITVAVSGAWPASLYPITDDLGFDAVVCSEPELDERARLTGRIRQAMFGPAKRQAVTDLLAKFGAEAADAHAYADDPGDLDVLRLVGHPTVVGEHPEMGELARGYGWPVLSGRTVRGTERRPV